MAFGTQDDTAEVMNEINMTPFVDVMLVLLIIFIITVPVMQHAVSVELPRASNQPERVKSETIRLSVDASGAYFWNAEPLAQEALQSRLVAAAAQVPQPELHIRKFCDTEGSRILHSSNFPHSWAETAFPRSNPHQTSLALNLPR